MNTNKFFLNKADNIALFNHVNKVAEPIHPQGHNPSRWSNFLLSSLKLLSLMATALAVTSASFAKDIKSNSKQQKMIHYISAADPGKDQDNIGNFSAGVRKFEAEDAAKLVGVKQANSGSGFSGNGYADYIDAANAYIKWNIKVSQAGRYQLAFVYALKKGNRPLRLTVNGTVVKDSLSFPGTGSWNSWKETETVAVKLQAGNNKILLTAIGKSGPNVDCLKLTGGKSSTAQSSSSAPVTATSTSSHAVPMIVDTDMMTDCDDTGALAIAHRLDHDGDISLIGVIVSTHDYHEKHCNVVSAINTYYGKPHLPIGMVDAAADPHKQWKIVRTSNCPFSEDIAAKFPNDGIPDRQRPDSNIVYRKLLHNAADHSVVIVVIGHLNAVANLLKTDGDSIDPRNGVELVKAKVKKLVIVGGGNILKLPRRRNMNFTGHRGVDAVDTATRYWIKHWPADAAEIVLVPDNVGGHIITGPIYKGSNTPMEIAYTKAYHGINGRPSWDQTGILVGAWGNTHNGVTYWKVETKGHLDIEMDKKKEAMAHWYYSPNKNHSFIIAGSGISNRQLTKVLNKLMDPSWAKK